MTSAATPTLDRLDPKAGQGRTNGVVEALLAAPARSIDMLDVGMLHEHPDNPRGSVGEVYELAESIRSVGILEPLIVATAGAWQDKDDRLPALGMGDYVVVAGHRRLAAAKLAKVNTVPCIVRDDLVGADAEVAMIIENLQREDLKEMDEARAFTRLRDLHGKSQSDIARLVGCSQAHVSKRISLSALPDEWQKKVGTSALSVTDAVEMARYADNPLAMKAIAARPSYQSVDQAAKTAIKTAQKKERLDKERKKLKDQGIPTVAWAKVGGYQGPQRLDHLKARGIDVTEHMHSSCHAIGLGYDYYSDTLRKEPVCTNPKVHEPEEKAAGEAAPNPHDEARAREAKAREKRRATRLAAIAAALTSSVDNEVEQLAMSWLLADQLEAYFGDHDAIALAKALGLDGFESHDTPVDLDDALDAIKAYAARSAKDMKRTVVTTQLVIAEAGAEDQHSGKVWMSAAFLTWLEAHGHKLTAQERAVVKAREDALRDLATQAAATAEPANGES